MKMGLVRYILAAILGACVLAIPLVVTQSNMQLSPMIAPGLLVTLIIAVLLAGVLLYIWREKPQVVATPTTITATANSAVSYGLTFTVVPGGRLDTAYTIYYGPGFEALSTVPSASTFVKFNASGTPSIIDSKNVSSITDNGRGDFTINFTTPLQSDSYAVTPLADMPPFSTTRTPGGCRVAFDGGVEPDHVAFRFD